MLRIARGASTSPASGRGKRRPWLAGIKSRSRLAIPPPDLVLQKLKSKHLEAGAFLVVLAVAVAACFGLVEISLVAHRLELCRHLARVAGMDTVIAPRGGDQDR